MFAFTSAVDASRITVPLQRLPSGQVWSGWFVFFISFRGRTSTDPSRPGSPLTYIPLSVHVPEHFRQLRDRQLIFTRDQQAWWVCERAHPLLPPSIGGAPVIDAHASTDSELPTVHSDAPVTLKTASPDLSLDLSAAIDTPLTPVNVFFLGNGEPQLKTSESHPIKSVSFSRPIRPFITQCLHSIPIQCLHDDTLRAARHYIPPPHPLQTTQSHPLRHPPRILSRQTHRLQPLHHLPPPSTAIPTTSTASTTEHIPNRYLDPERARW